MEKQRYSGKKRVSVWESMGALLAAYNHERDKVPYDRYGEKLVKKGGSRT